MGFLKALLFPFSIIYDLVTRLRNHLFDIGYKQSFEFDTNVIGVGNLTVGGTGKTPMVEYLIRLLHNYKTSTLSRGYGRKTKGFRIANVEDTAITIGDEPYQFFRKFKNVMVTVGEERAMAIPQILADSDTEVIVMDDSYQHRYVKPSFNILLTDFNRPFFNDFVLPYGRLRESRNGAKRADVIVVTKCPNELSKSLELEYINEIKKYSQAPVYFSEIKYDKPVLGNESNKPFSNNVLLFSGLANNTPFTNYISENFSLLDEIYFEDHHQYTKRDLSKIEERYSQFNQEDKCIVTTEKDFVKLIEHDLYGVIEHWPLYYIPITTGFLKDGNMFDKHVMNSIKSNFE